MGGRRMLLCLMVALFQHANAEQPSTAALPKFSDFPVQRRFTAAPAVPQFSTSGQRLFETVIRKAAGHGPNFAGHYTVAEWGCGTSCVSVAIVDAETGVIHEGPFGPLPHAVLSYGEPLQYDRDEKGEYQFTELSYRLDSRLLIARGCPNDANCAAYFYEWTGTQFQLLRKLPATRKPR